MSPAQAQSNTLVIPVKCLNTKKSRLRLFEYYWLWVCPVLYTHELLSGQPGVRQNDESTHKTSSALHLIGAPNSF